MIQLILHLLGDYVLQSDWMAQRKTKCSFAAYCHALVYSLPFLCIASSVAFMVIFLTHFLIDRFRLARYVVYLKNFLSPKVTLEITNGKPSIVTWWHSWEDCKGTGYHKDTPPFLAVWLMIVADNTLHLLINHLSIKYL